MYVPFEELPESSKIWIYQSNRKFEKREEVEIGTNLKNFVEKWTSHSNVLRASFDIKHNYFIIVAVDTSVNDTSGCSQDSLFRQIKEIQQKFNLDLMDREKLGFLIDGKVKLISLNNIKNEIKRENINIQSKFFNNLAHFLGDLQDNWLMSIEKTWLKKYF